MKKLFKIPIFLSAGILVIMLLIVAVVLVSCGSDKDTAVSDTDNLVAENTDVSEEDLMDTSKEEGGNKTTEEIVGGDVSQDAESDADTSQSEDIGVEEGEDASKVESESGTEPKEDEEEVSKEEESKEDVKEEKPAGNSGANTQTPVVKPSDNGTTQSKPGTGDNKPAQGSGTSGGGSTPSTPSQGGNANSQGGNGGSGGAVAPHTCAWDSGVVTTQATCNKEGVKTYTCSCGKTKTESIAKVSHNYVTQNTTASCTEGGVEKTYCSMCGYVQSEKVVEAKGHVSSGQKYYWNGPPSCSHTSSYQYICAVCGYGFGEMGKDPALPHTKVTTMIKEPTCAHSGRAKIHCSVCGKDYNSYDGEGLGVVDIPPTGNHTWVTVEDDWWDYEIGDYVHVVEVKCSVCLTPK